jgi:hypothetical protein
LGAFVTSVGKHGSIHVGKGWSNNPACLGSGAFPTSGRLVALGLALLARVIGLRGCLAIGQPCARCPDESNQVVDCG